MKIARYIISILLLAFIACSSPIKVYEDQPEVKAWEPAIEKFDSLDKAEHYADDAVLFAGSSSIRLWSALAEDMAPYSVIQRGYGGAKLSDFAVYADRIFSPHPCKALVLFVANDITGGLQDKSPEEVKRLFLFVLKTFRKTHPDTPVFWIAITPSSSRWKAWPEISKVNELIKGACQKRPNTYFIRTDFAFLGTNGEPKDELFRTDRLHLNADGYKIWTSIIKRELNSVLKK
jgi:hypothetical protein